MTPIVQTLTKELEGRAVIIQGTHHKGVEICSNHCFVTLARKPTIHLASLLTHTWHSNEKSLFFKLIHENEHLNSSNSPTSHQLVSIFVSGQFGQCPVFHPGFHKMWYNAVPVSESHLRPFQEWMRQRVCTTSDPHFSDLHKVAHFSHKIWQQNFSRKIWQLRLTQKKVFFKYVNMAEPKTGCFLTTCPMNWNKCSLQNKKCPKTRILKLWKTWAESSRRSSNCSSCAAPGTGCSSCVPRSGAQ